MSNNRILFSTVRDLLLEGESVKITVQGQSMLPFFRSGSTILLRPIREEDFRPLTVVMADAGRHFVVHRILRVEGDLVTLLGDGNLVGTETMPREKVYGVVDCSRLHRCLAWCWMKGRVFRRFPLALLRRICRK